MKPGQESTDLQGEKKQLIKHHIMCMLYDRLHIKVKESLHIKVKEILHIKVKEIFNDVVLRLIHNDQTED